MLGRRSGNPDRRPGGGYAPRRATVRRSQYDDAADAPSFGRGRFQGRGSNSRDSAPEGRGRGTGARNPLPRSRQGGSAIPQPRSRQVTRGGRARGGIRGGAGGRGAGRGAGNQRNPQAPRFQPRSILSRLEKEDPQAANFIRELKDRIIALERGQAHTAGRQGAAPTRGRFSRTRRDPAPPAPNRGPRRTEGTRRGRDDEHDDRRDTRRDDYRSRFAADSGRGGNRRFDDELPAPRQRRRLEEDRGAPRGGRGGGRGNGPAPGNGRGPFPPIAIRVRN